MRYKTSHCGKFWGGGSAKDCTFTILETFEHISDNINLIINHDTPQGKIKVRNCSKFGEKIKLPQNANKGYNIARILVPDDIQVVSMQNFHQKDTSAKVVIIGVPAPFTATCTNQVRPHSKSRFNICFENQVSPFHFCIESTIENV